MKTFEFDLCARPNRWESYSYSGIVIANTKEEAIGLICENCNKVTRSDFHIGQADESEYICEIDTSVPKVYISYSEHFEA